MVRSLLCAKTFGQKFAFEGVSGTVIIVGTPKYSAIVMVCFS